MLVILFATIGFGQALSRVQGYVAGAREAARYVAVHCESTAGCSTGAVQTRAQDGAGTSNPITYNGWAVTSSSGAALPNCTPASFVTVSWSQPVTIEIPFIPTFNLSVPISGTFRCE
jgi:hypothetical protein